MYLLILGANKCKTEIERQQEDDEEIKALKETNKIIEKNNKYEER